MRGRARGPQGGDRLVPAGGGAGASASRHALADMHGHGAGVAIDLVTAYQWWQITADQGHPLAVDLLMSARELNLARSLAAEWQRFRAAP